MPHQLQYNYGAVMAIIDHYEGKETFESLANVDFIHVDHLLIDIKMFSVYTQKKTSVCDSWHFKGTISFEARVYPDLPL